MRWFHMLLKASANGSTSEFASRRGCEFRRRESDRDFAARGEMRLALLMKRCRTSKLIAPSANRDASACQFPEPDAKRFARAANPNSIRRERAAPHLQPIQFRKSNRH